MLYYLSVSIIPYPLLFSSAIIPLSPFCLDHLLFCLMTIGSTGLLTLLSRLLLSQLLLSRLLIVLTYYTALDRHSIHSSTFPLYNSLSRVSCLSWQSTRS